MSFLSQYHYDFLKALNDSEVQFLVIGGQAAIYYGVRRGTGDMDILIKPTQENGTRLLQAFKSLNLQVDDLQVKEFEKPLFLTLGFEPDAVDILTITPGVDFDISFKQAQVLKESDVILSVIGIEDLIKNKESLNREGEKKALDEYDVLVLKRILKERY